MKAVVGYSTNLDAEKAGLEAAKKAGSPKTTKLAFVYCSCDYDIESVIKGIKKVYSCPIIGNTSFTGVVVPEGYIGGDKPFVGIMGIIGKDLEVGVSIMEKSDSKASAVAIGEKVAISAHTKVGKDIAPKAMYMVGSPTEEEFYLKGITNIVGRVPFFGGSAADNTISGNWKLFTDEKVIGEGVAIALLYTNDPIANVFTGAYKETKDMGIITKVDGNRKLVEINNKPALKVYAKWRKMKPKDLLGGNLLSATITSPLGVKDRLGDLVAIRHPMAGNEDMSMNIGNQLAVGTCVIRMESSIDEIISSVTTTLKSLKAKFGKTEIAAYHLVHCGGRRAGIDSRIEEVYKATKKVVGDTPFIMEFTFGEYGTEQDGINTCGGLMLSFTAFAK